jgi:HK97 family phage portal protein
MAGAFELSQPFEQSWIVNLCCRLWSRASASVRPMMWNGPGANAEEVPESDPFLQQLLRPNRDMTWAQLAEADVVHRKLSGESFWFLFGPKSTDGNWAPFDGPITLPFSIMPVNGDAVEYDPDDMGRPAFWYFQTAGNQRLRAPWSSVVQFRDYDPADPIRGLGAAEVANRQLQIAFQAERQQEAQMRSGGPGAFVTYDHDIQRDALESFQSDLDAATQDAETAGGLKILGGGPKIVPNPATPDRMQYIDLLTWSRDVVASTFEVPVHLISPDASTYSNLQEAWRQFWIAVVGYLKTVEAQINAQLIPRMADPRFRQYVFGFDFAGIEALRNDQSARLKVAAEISLATGVDLGELVKALKLDIDGSVFASEEMDEDEEENESEEIETEDEPDPAEDQTAVVADQALNGAQVSSLLDILRAVSEGLLTVEGAVTTILAAFPFIDEEEARRIVGGVNEAPAPAPAPVAAAVDPAFLIMRRRDIAAHEVKAIDLAPPAYMRASARRGIKLHEAGESGQGLKPQTVEDARKMAAGEVTEAKWRKIGPWIARHKVDLEAVQGDEITPGLVSMLLWGGGSSSTSASRAQAYAEDLVARIDAEREKSAAGMEPSIKLGPLETREARAEYFRRFLRDVSLPFEKRAQKNVGKWLAGYERELLRKLRRFAETGKDFSELVTKADEATPNPFVSALVPDPKEWLENLNKALDDVLSQAFKAALKDQALELGGISLPMSDPRIVRALETQKIKVVEGVHSTVAKRVKNTLDKELGQPSSFVEMRQRIEEVLPELEGSLKQVFADKTGRAGVIARTEITKATNTARELQMREEGVEQVQWISERDDDVRETHQELDGQIRPLGEDFKPQLAYPGDDRAPAEEVINCRCLLMAIVPEP